MLRIHMRSKVRRHRTERSCVIHLKRCGGGEGVSSACYKCSNIGHTRVLVAREEGAERSCMTTTVWPLLGETSQLEGHRSRVVLTLARSWVPPTLQRVRVLLTQGWPC